MLKWNVLSIAQLMLRSISLWRSCRGQGIVGCGIGASSKNVTLCTGWGLTGCMLGSALWTLLHKTYRCKGRHAEQGGLLGLDSLHCTQIGALLYSSFLVTSVLAPPPHIALTPLQQLTSEKASNMWPHKVLGRFHEYMYSQKKSLLHQTLPQPRFHSKDPVFLLV